MKNLKHSKSLALLGMLLFLSSCGVNNVVINGEFPTPNVIKMPLSIAVFYDDTLKEHAYIEYSETGGEEFNIQSGLSHIQLFNTVVPAMFQSVVFVDSLEEASGLGVDAVFMPAIEEFQLALPAKTKLGVYEIWIKYNMRLVGADGSSLADWVMTSYGKSPTETFRSIDDAINDAAVVALRDLASTFSLGFGRVPEVNDWLNTL